MHAKLFYAKLFNAKLLSLWLGHKDWVTEKSVPLLRKKDCFFYFILMRMRKHEQRKNIKKNDFLRFFTIYFLVPPPPPFSFLGGGRDKKMICHFYNFIHVFQSKNDFWFVFFKKFAFIGANPKIWKLQIKKSKNLSILPKATKIKI